MKKLLVSILSVVGLVGLLPAVAWAKGKAAPLVVVAYTKGLSGINLWWANIYNDSMLLFTILTGCFAPIAGILLGFLADRAIRLTGIDLTKRELREH